MNLIIKTIYKDNDEWDEYLKKIEKFIEISNFNDKLIHNYSIQRLQIPIWVGLSVYMTTEGNMLGFSSVITRKEFYGNGCRILNRFIKSPKYRFAKNDMSTKQMILQQVELSTNLGFDYAFMSRESNTGATPFKYYVHDKLGLVDWTIEKDKYYVCNGDSSCEQYIVWTPLSKKCNNVQLKKVLEK